MVRTETAMSLNNDPFNQRVDARKKFIRGRAALRDGVVHVERCDAADLSVRVGRVDHRHVHRYAAEDAGGNAAEDEAPRARKGARNAVPVADGKHRRTRRPPQPLRKIVADKSAAGQAFHFAHNRVPREHRPKFHLRKLDLKLAGWVITIERDAAPHPIQMIATPQHRTRGRRSVTDEVPEPGPLERPLRFEKLRELLLRERRIRDVLRRSEVGVEPRNSIADVVAREKLRRTVSVLGKKSLAVHSGIYFEMYLRFPGGPQVGLDALEGRERERDARVRSRHEMLGKRAPQNEYGFRDPLFPEA